MTNKTNFNVGAESKALAYFAAQQFNGQWRAFVVALITELYANANDSDAVAFLGEVGARTARLMPITKVSTLDKLEVEMNKGLEAINWGVITLTVEESYIRILHTAAPAIAVEDQDGLWPKAFAAILKGFYRQWFLFQDSPKEFMVSAATIATPGTFEFHYGR